MNSTCIQNVFVCNYNSLPLGNKEDSYKQSVTISKVHTLYCNIKCHYIQSAHIVLQYVRRKVLGKTLVSLYPVSFREVASTGLTDKLSVGMDRHRLAQPQPISPMSPQGDTPPPPRPLHRLEIFPGQCHVIIPKVYSGSTLLHVVHGAVNTFSPVGLPGLITTKQVGS